MNDSCSSLDLSPAARERQQAILPGLLSAVKHRRRRRQTMRAGAAILVIGSVVGLLLQSTWGGVEPRHARPEVRTPGWTTIRDDVTSIERYAVPTVRRAEWFVDDDGLNTLLLESGRRSGVVRASGRVQVNPAAVDPWPAAASESE